MYQVVFEFKGLIFACETTFEKHFAVGVCSVLQRLAVGCSKLQCGLCVKATAFISRARVRD